MVRVVRRRQRWWLAAALAVLLTLLTVGVGWGFYLNRQIDDVRRIAVDFGAGSDGEKVGAPSGSVAGGTTDGAADSAAGGAPVTGATGSTSGADTEVADADVADTDVAGTDEEAGSPTGREALTILVAGVDAGEGPRIAQNLAEGTWTRGRYRTDTIMVVHLTADRRAAYLVSIPRDAWVRVPGYGARKVNAAFSIGGPSLLVQSVERLTGTDLDHLMIVDWKAFKAVTRAVGGVEVHIPRDVYDPSQEVQWRAGTQVLQGQRALQYVRQRHGLPGGDFGRIRRQQNFVRATLDKVLSRGTLLNPVKVTGVIGALGDHLLVDDGLGSAELRSLALSVRHLDRSSVRFVTLPTYGLDRVEGRSVVRVDRPLTRRLFDALDNGRGERFLRRHDVDRLADLDRVP